jgi:uncharacterized protein (DUF3084 family)
MNAQPSFVKDAYQTVLEQGSCGSGRRTFGIIQVETQSTQAAQPANDAVGSSATSCKSSSNTSTTQPFRFACWSPAGVSRDERVAAMSPAQMRGNEDGHPTKWSNF